MLQIRNDAVTKSYEVVHLLPSWSSVFFLLLLSRSSYKCNAFEWQAGGGKDKLI